MVKWQKQSIKRTSKCVSLNTGKGPAVRALRAQADKVLYQQEMKKVIEDEENLDIMQGMVDDLIIEDDVIKGVRTNIGTEYWAEA